MQVWVCPEQHGTITAVFKNQVSLHMRLDWGECFRVYHYRAERKEVCSAQGTVLARRRRRITSVQPDEADSTEHRHTDWQDVLGYIL